MAGGVRTVARIGARAGISLDITAHGLCLTFASAGFARGVSLRDMELGLRHARSETTTICDMNYGAMDRRACHEIAAFLAGFPS